MKAGINASGDRYGFGISLTGLSTRPATADFMVGAVMWMRYSIDARGCALPGLDPLWLFLSLFPSGVGFVLFVYGKKRDRWPQLIAGLGFMVYPYFTPSVAALGGVGLVLTAALWFAIRLGW
jgi:hypothetical protein